MGRIPATEKTLWGLLLLFRPIEDWYRANSNVKWLLGKLHPCSMRTSTVMLRAPSIGTLASQCRFPSSSTLSNYITADRVLLRSNLILALFYA